MTDHSIKGKTVLIAGGGKNLGGLVARDLAAAGARAIAVHYNTAASAKETEETLAAIRAAGAEAVAFQADLTSAAAMEKLFADTIAATLRAGDRQPDRRSEAGSDPAGPQAPTDTPASITPTGTDA